MEEFGKLEERVVLVGVQTDDHGGGIMWKNPWMN